ncbi:PREDICTED: uncharacterized protein LOC106323435 [Brassica oleracea var. oleracea]|uniref:KIB1-4 beta-propeller domain-containing protein n=1 Tax=Brassica oleracea var. oleracea TaxID=109376 RepID=A0A0D3AM54_BRAOL|nr:PREDICTED: uncharacterized protein LOC106323434 [Brassica oleracea var. oleracea]XP_013617015.1 PREDICTED: uncharacterized protein LOC106323435 [Brassica oleracea var. oleracea]
MSLLLRRLWKLCHGKPAGAVVKRSSLLLSSNSYSSSSLLQTPPCFVLTVAPCGEDLGKLVIVKANEFCITDLEKKVPLDLVDTDEMLMVGASNGWVATLKDDGIVRLQDDLNPFASDTNPKRIPLPPLVTLPRCQTQMVTNMAMSSSSPEDMDCVVSLKFFGPQLSFCRPGGKPEWTNIRIANPCFYSSPVVFSKKHGMFRILASGGYLIGSWDARTDKKSKPKFQRLRFRNVPNLSKTKRELLSSCCTSEHLVESGTTGETFLVKLYRRPRASGSEKMQTKALMVFKIDDEGNAVYTQDIGDLCIFLSKSEPFCVPASSFPGMTSNRVAFLDFDENVYISVPCSNIIGGNCPYVAPYHIPPQNIV